MAKALPQPTTSELAILKILWERERCTVRDVYETTLDDRKWGYTTVLKLMQIMVEKGLVKRDTKQHKHVYWAARSQDKTRGGLLRDLLDRAFGSSTEELVMQALSDKKVSKKELAEIRKLVTKLEQDRE